MIRESIRHRTSSTKGTEDASSLATQGMGLVQVENGASFGPWPAASKTVGYVRQQLATPYNIHPDAVAVLNGKVVTEDHVLRKGDVLAFHKISGAKGVGSVWTKEEFMKLFHMDEAAWQDWNDNGLPSQQLPNGTIVLNETQVDSWLRRKQAYDDSIKMLSEKPDEWFKLGQWYHLPFEDRPDEYRAGPMRGSKVELSRWLRPGKDDRELERAARTGAVWVRRYTRDTWEVWFKEQSYYAFTNQNRIREQEG